MATIYKVNVLWKYEGKIDHLGFFFSTKERAESFKKNFRNDCKNMDIPAFVNKYRINQDTADEILMDENLIIDILEILMDEEF